MKKLIINFLLLSFVMILTGCDTMNTPTKRTEEYLSKYNTLDSGVLSDLDLSAEKENLSTDNSELYKNVLKHQYENMKYEIVNESVDGDDAVVTTKITVYDLYKSSLNSDTFLSQNQESFLKDGIYDENTFLKYKLEQMKETKETIEYTVDIYLNKIDDKWIVQDLDEETKQKIHGLYNYEV